MDSQEDIIGLRVSEGLRTAVLGAVASGHAPHGTGARSSTDVPMDLGVEQDGDLSDDRIRKLLEGLVSGSRVKLPADVHSRIRAVHQRLVSNVMKLQKSCARVHKLRESIALLEADKIPNNVKPYKLGFECSDLDDCVYGEDKTLTLKIRAGQTFRQVKHFLYYWSVSRGLEVDVELNSKQVENQTAAENYATFVAECCGPSTEHATAISDLCIPLPLGLFEDRTTDVENFAKQLTNKLSRRRPL